MLNSQSIYHTNKPNLFISFIICLYNTYYHSCESFWALDSSLRAARSVVFNDGDFASVSFFSATSPSMNLYFLIGVALKLDCALIFLISSSSYLIFSWTSRAFYSAYWRSLSFIAWSKSSLLTLRSVLAILGATAFVAFLSDFTFSGINTFLLILTGVAWKLVLNFCLFSSASIRSWSFFCAFSPLLVVVSLNYSNYVALLGDGGLTPLLVLLKSGICLALKLYVLDF